MFKHNKIAMNTLDLVLTIVETLNRTLGHHEWGFESHHICLLNFINHY